MKLLKNEKGLKYLISRKIIGFLVVFMICLSGAYANTGCIAYEDYQTQCYPVRPRIDVVFLIDSTGSMADEIREVKTHIIKIVKDVESGQPSPELRVGVVTYRDHENEEREYLLKSFDLTYDIEHALEFIEIIQAQGGGDYPEAVADGLFAAVNKMNWDSNARKLVFLIGDAPPHGEGSRDGGYYVQGCPSNYNYRNVIRDAIEKDISIYTVSGSGMDSIGINIWRDIALETGGEYSHLTYERVDVDQYVEEEGIDARWAEEIKKDKDYDRKSNSFLRNSFGSVAKQAVISEAKEMGVEYEDDEVDNSWIDADDITGDAVKEEESEDFFEFLERIFDKLIFWD